jgi:predicted component of type VI protein secretion system
MVIEIAGVKIRYKSIPELPEAIKAELARIETRLKKVTVKYKKLRRAYRGLTRALEGNKSAPKQPAVPAA